MAQTRSSYIHGSSPSEHRRMALLNELLNKRCLSELSLSPGARVLDVGAGFGQFSRMMSEVVGTDGCVVAVERDEKQVAAAEAIATESGAEAPHWRIGDVLDLPLSVEEQGTFDVAFARFILEHVNDPLRVVGNMISAVRPGGRIVLADDDHDTLRLWPEPPGFLSIWREYMRIYDRLGNDPFIGRRLVDLLYRAGARPVRNTLVFFGSCSGSPEFSAFVTNLAEVVRGSREAIVTQLGVNAFEFDGVLETFQAWSRRPDAAIWYGLCWAEGVRGAD